MLRFFRKEGKVEVAVTKPIVASFDEEKVLRKARYQFAREQVFESLNKMFPEDLPSYYRNTGRRYLLSQITDYILEQEGISKPL
ncbi:hypothetical protein N9924_00675 [bacterium]|nr:hypothetical protein [bacterium]